MRLTLQLLPLLLLLLLPFLGFSLLPLLLLLPCILLLRTVLVFFKLGERKKDERVILETISISHYVEKVRWCLDYLGLPYVEEENVGILGIFFLGRSVPQLKVPGKGLEIANSSTILRYLHGEHYTHPAREAFLRPTPKSLELEEKFDMLGEHYRRLCYYNGFTNPLAAQWNLCAWGLYQPKIPAWQKLSLKLLAPVFQMFVSNRLRVTEEEARRSLQEARNICQEVDDLLSDGRQFLLDTPKPSYLDFHFCSMAAIIMMNDQVPEYSGGVLSTRTLDELNRNMPCHAGQESSLLVEERSRLEESRAGKFIKSCFKDFRFAQLE